MVEIARLISPLEGEMAAREVRASKRMLSQAMLPQLFLKKFPILSIARRMFSSELA
ncbi:hypothetical protein SAMN04488498_1183 [Mesorhizobium albiziae]|uniref:Uncharacterized protein n=1 Tax=Neomesorhizobium albiziae TaxID=335020 RepID=A0A1I4DK71_9HYPH|nr:hypothetical protein GCM10007937_30630 [Mesorhizobium albiziae]SFK93299.1 hypothetical protein SAMN04488498_1183 [Mesorhizobium albiziae]